MPYSLYQLINNITNPGFLLQIYQRKHAELLTATSTASATVPQPSALPQQPSPLTPNLVNNEYLQSLIQLTLTQQAQQFATLQQQLSQDNTSDIEMQSTSSTNIPQLISNSSGNGNDKTAPSTPSAIRNRRTLSGSGSTISQHTRDRLKNMIATKKQKQQRLGSSGSSSGSQTNLSNIQPTTPLTNGGPSSSLASSAGTGSLTWIPPNNGVVESNLIQQLAAAAIHQSSRHQTSSAATGTSHFEPYPLPSSTNSHHAQMSEFQLRKVNSEPNLKMRLRARLLNKGSSPIAQQHQSSSQTPQSASQSANGNSFLPPPASSSTPHRQLQRCDSENLQFENLICSPIETPLIQSTSTAQLPFPANLMMMPSPSLPNLCNGLDQLQIDYTNLMLQSALTSFLSMPSLLKNQLLPNSIMDPQQGNDDGSGKRLHYICDTVFKINTLFLPTLFKLSDFA